MVFKNSRHYSFEKLLCRVILNRSSLDSIRELYTERFSIGDAGVGKVGVKLIRVIIICVMKLVQQSTCIGRCGTGIFVLTILVELVKAISTVNTVNIVNTVNTVNMGTQAT